MEYSGNSGTLSYVFKFCIKIIMRMPMACEVQKDVAHAFCHCSCRSFRSVLMQLPNYHSREIVVCQICYQAVCTSLLIVNIGV